MASLEHVIWSLYHNDFNYRRPSAIQSGFIPTRYMEIPVDKDTFELPVLAIDGFTKMLATTPDADVLVAPLQMSDITSDYKSFDSIIKDTLSRNFQKLWKIKLAGSPNEYYGCAGALFDSTLMPVMMMSWIMERYESLEGMKYQFVRPVLRISPLPIVSKSDAIQRFLSGKMLSTTLAQTISHPRYSDSHFPYDPSTFKVKVEIDDNPFMIKSPDRPSMSITNKSLLELVSEHIDEIHYDS